MIDQSTSELEEKVGNKYTLCILAARRARQLKEGYPSMAPMLTSSHLTVALAEIEDDRVLALQPEELPAEPIQHEPSLAELLAGGALSDDGDDGDEERLLTLDEELAQASAALGALEDEDVDADDDGDVDDDFEEDEDDADEDDDSGFDDEDEEDVDEEDLDDDLDSSDDDEDDSDNEDDDE